MRRLLLMLLVAGAALALSACGSSSSSEDFDVSTPTDPAAQAVVQAGQKSADAGTARASFSATFTGTTSGTMTGEGEFSKREGHLTLDMSDLAGGNAFGSGKAELTFSDLVYYLKLPEGAGLPLPPGKEWFKIDLRKLGQTNGLNLEQLTQLSQSDPSQALDFLQGASDDFHQVGTEDVRGEPTTHYAGTIDLHKVAENAPADLAEQYKQLAELAPSSSVPMDVWIGDDGYVHKLRFEQKLAAGSSMTMEEELYDWGTNVDVSPPSDDQVVDLTQLLGQS